MDEGGDASQRGPSLQHAAVTVVDSCGDMPVNHECSSARWLVTLIVLLFFFYLICIWSKDKTSGTHWQSKTSGNPGGGRYRPSDKTSKYNRGICLVDK